MDWSKAKTILIIALLITNMILGGYCVADIIQDRNAELLLAKNAEKYLAERGIEFNVNAPKVPQRLPVAFVRFASEDAGKLGEKIKTSYKGIPVEGEAPDGYVVVIESLGKSKGRLISSSKALLELVSRSDAADISRITEIRLVYRVDNMDYASKSVRDTAMPCWCFETDAGSFYVTAYDE